jgi:hypothetical protein
MTRLSEGSAAYEAVAEELSAPGIALGDLDAGTVALAQEHARKAHKRWPPRPATSGWQMAVVSFSTAE